MYFILLCTVFFPMKNIDPSIYLFDWRDVRIRYADDPPFKYRVTFKIVDRIFIEGLREKKSSVYIALATQIMQPVCIHRMSYASILGYTH